MMLSDFKAIKFANKTLYWLATNRKEQSVRYRKFCEENAYSEKLL
jgi:hypothetical protein